MKNNPDYILYNGNFISMERPDKQYCAIGITGETITEVWEKPCRMPKRFFGTKMLDLEGRTVLPGFIDSNVHMVQGGLMQYCVEIKADTREAFLQQLQQKVQAFEAGELIWCIGYNEDTVELNRWDLDQITSIHPVVVSKTEFHKTILNTSAYNLLKIPYSISGIQRDEKGMPTGVLQGEASGFARRKLYTCFVTDDIRRLALADMERKAFRCGITTVNAMEGGAFFSNQDIRMVQRFAEHSRLEIFLFPQTMDVATVQEAKLPRIGGNIYLDGSIGSQTAALYEPYIDGEHQGVLYYSQEDVNQFVLEAHTAGLQIALSCIGPRAIEQALAAFAAAFEIAGRKNLRHRLELFVLPTEAQITWAISMGLILSMRANYDRQWGGAEGKYAALLGDRWKGTNSIGAVVAQGGIVAGGSEYAVTPLNPLKSIGSCLLHHNAVQQLSLYDALRTYTANGAYANMAEDRIGSLGIGMQADLVVLDQNLCTLSPAEIETLRVEMTIKKGEIVYAREDVLWK